MLKVVIFSPDSFSYLNQCLKLLYRVRTTIFSWIGCSSKTIMTTDTVRSQHTFADSILIELKSLCNHQIIFNFSKMSSIDFIRVRKYCNIESLYVHFLKRSFKTVSQKSRVYRVHILHKVIRTKTCFFTNLSKK
jgi:hypothetical protein